MTDPLPAPSHHHAADAPVTSRTHLTEWSLQLGTAAPEAPAHAVATLAAGLAVEVPTSVLAALVAAGIVPDVARGGDEHAIAWASASTWSYRRAIARRGDGAHVTLRLEGVDTIAAVRVDGQVVGHTDNMFHAWDIDLGVDHQRGVDQEPGHWDVEIEFQPALPVAQAREAEHPLPRADMYDLPFNQVRKMASSFGWDWGPTTISAGLWREAVLIRTYTAALTDVGLDANWTGAGAVLRCGLSAQGAGASVVVIVREPGGTAPLAALEQELTQGQAQLSLPIPDARQWHVRGYGEQPLYDVDIELRDGAGLVIDRMRRRVGFRSVALMQTPDDDGQSFEIHVNGQRIWARGFNWIPADMLPERLDAAHVRALITAAVDAGANMLRVWGGGTIESHDFFDICDELGVIVWQDFAFACAAYPEDDVQVARVEREVADAVRRVGHRASLVIWCGCNENLWGYEDWGWKETLAPGQGWGERLYRDVIPGALARLDPHRPYIPGSPFSPQAGVHPNDEGQGPTHHWDTWNDLDYVAFEDKRSRFASEFGWQAPASWPTLVEALGREPHGPRDEGVARMQKHPLGRAALARAVADHVPHLPDDGPGWYFATQLVQARALRASIGRFRSLHDSCSGVLWWQLNDCWPALSWSVIDVAGRRKLAWYAAREVFVDRAVLPSAEGEPAGLTLVNDTAHVWTPSGTVRVIDAEGRVLSDTPLVAEVSPGGHAIVLPGGGEQVAGAVAVIVDADGERSVRWLADDLALLQRGTLSTDRAPSTDGALWTDGAPNYPAARVVVESVRSAADAVTVRVRADSLVRDLVLLAETHRWLADATVDRQLLTLLPGEHAEFTITAHRAHELRPPDWAALLMSDAIVEAVVEA